MSDDWNPSGTFTLIAEMRTRRWWEFWKPKREWRIAGIEAFGGDVKQAPSRSDESPISSITSIGPGE